MGTIFTSRERSIGVCVCVWCVVARTPTITHTHKHIADATDRSLVGREEDNTPTQDTGTETAGGYASFFFNCRNYL